jgi:manganese efflux pump family protein
MKRQPQESTGLAGQGCTSVAGAGASPGVGEAVGLAIKVALAVGGVLTALALSGCGAHAAGASGGRPQPSVRSCAAFGYHAIEHRITVTREPAPCEGLSKAEVNQAVAMAVLRVSGDVPKALRRKRAAEAARYLYHLVTAQPPPAAASPLPAGSSPPRGRDLPMSIAAFIAWLVTAGIGSYLLGSWIAHGGSLRRRGSAGLGSPPPVIVGHAGLALTGLAVWTSYLVTGRAALAWIAVGVLLPVAGLGMATLAIGLPQQSRLAAEGGTAQPFRLNAPSAEQLTMQPGGKSRARVLLLIAGHGVLAATTVAVVLLAALGTAAG